MTETNRFNAITTLIGKQIDFGRIWGHTKLRVSTRDLLRQERRIIAPSNRITVAGLHRGSNLEFGQIQQMTHKELQEDENTANSSLQRKLREEGAVDIKNIADIPAHIIHIMDPRARGIFGSSLKDDYQDLQEIPLNRLSSASEEQLPSTKLVSDECADIPKKLVLVSGVNSKALESEEGLEDLMHQVEEEFNERYAA